LHRGAPARTAACGASDPPGRRPHVGPASPCPRSSAQRLPVLADRAIQRVRRAAGQYLPGAADRAPVAALDSETVVTTVGPGQLELSQSPVLVDRERVCRLRAGRSWPAHDHLLPGL